MAYAFSQRTQSYANIPKDLRNRSSGCIASSVTSAALHNGHVTQKPDGLSDSPLACWPEAKSITTALYKRNESALLQPISKALRTYPTAEVYDKLAELVDYLDLPDSVQQLLPPLSVISIQHLPVLDLHYYALSKQAVDLMLTSTAFANSSSSTWKSNAAYFFVSTREADGQLAGVSVYAVGGGNLQEPSWACTGLQGSANSNIDAGRDLTAVLLNPDSSSSVTNTFAGNTGRSSETDGGKSGSRQQQLPESVPFWDVARTDSSNGSVLVKGISQNHRCFGCHLEALMTEATSSICSVGRSGGVRVACGCVEHRAGGYMYEVGVANLWVVYW